MHVFFWRQCKWTMKQMMQNNHPQKHVFLQITTIRKFAKRMIAATPYVCHKHLVYQMEDLAQ